MIYVYFCSSCQNLPTIPLLRDIMSMKHLFLVIHCICFKKSRMIKSVKRKKLRNEVFTFL